MLFFLESNSQDSSVNENYGYTFVPKKHGIAFEMHGLISEEKGIIFLNSTII